jgi:hypothetical protein
MKKYVLIGAGGTGSHFIAPGLAYLRSLHDKKNEEWELVIVDGDAYESKNLERQIFDPSFTGMNKAEALVSMYSHYPVRAIPQFVGEEDLKTIIGEHTTVFIGVDNFSLRALVEQRALKLKNCIVINAGNEMHDGNVQLWVRSGGKNKTPRLSFCHPEIAYISDEDRAYMSCLQVSQLPGGEQLIIANFTAAQNMLLMLWKYHNGDWKKEKAATEIQFDLKNNVLDHIDMRQRVNWEKNTVGKVVTNGVS